MSDIRSTIVHVRDNFDPATDLSHGLPDHPSLSQRPTSKLVSKRSLEVWRLHISPHAPRRLTPDKTDQRARTLSRGCSRAWTPKLFSQRKVDCPPTTTTHESRASRKTSPQPQFGILDSCGGFIEHSGPRDFPLPPLDGLS